MPSRGWICSGSYHSPWRWALCRCCAYTVERRFLDCPAEPPIEAVLPSLGSNQTESPRHSQRLALSSSLSSHILAHTFLLILLTSCWAAGLLWDFVIITGVTGFVGTYNDYLNGMWLSRLIFQIAGPLSAAKLGRIEWTV